MSLNAVLFPNMLNTTNVTLVITDSKSATYQNLRLLLLSTKKTLLGDPYFGTNLRNMLFEKNNIILRDIVIDDIFTNITIYMPLIRIERKNIQVESDGKVVYVNIHLLNMIDYTFSDYTINLLNVEEV